MPKLTSTGELKAESWSMSGKDETLKPDQPDNENWLVHISQFASHKDALLQKTNIGVWLDSDDEVDDLASILRQVSVVAIHFPTFTDGRGFSIARKLRDQLDFEGELLATGQFMQDQLFYLKRCGFDAFLVADDADIASMRASLQDFSNSYQASVDEPRPLFRRRSH